MGWSGLVRWFVNIRELNSGRDGLHFQTQPARLLLIDADFQVVSFP